MEKLKVLKENAIKAFESADANGKKLLQDLFPGELVPVKITDRVKTLKDALDVLGIDEDDFTNSLIGMDTDEAAYRKLKHIALALNEGWKPDWTNSNEYKYYPYFNYKSGFGFSDTYYDGWNTITIVGSRLAYKSSELAAYAGKQFESIYNEYFNF